MENKIPIIIFTTRDSEFYGRRAIEETWLPYIDDDKFICLWYETNGNKDNPMVDMDSVYLVFDNLLNTFTFPYCLLITDSCYVNVPVLEKFELDNYLVYGKSGFYYFSCFILKVS